MITPALISLSKKDSILAPHNPNSYGLVKKSDPPQIRNWKIFGIWMIVFSFTVPVFRSGGRTNLTFWEWIINHSIYGKKVEYVPAEDYLEEMRD